MKPKVLVTREVFDETLEFLAQHCEVHANQADQAYTPDMLAEKLAACSGLMCALTDRVDAALLVRCPQLKAVANIAVGYNNIDVPACTARGIMVTNTPGVLDDSTADLAWALMLATARRITEVESYIRKGEWTGWKLKQWLGTDVHHATLGIVGMGRIGQAIAHRAQAFGMQIAYHTRTPKADVSYAYHADLLSLARDSDFLVLITPGGPGTRHLVNAQVLQALGPKGILVNVARGSVVDEAALIEALEGGVIGGAALDVFEDEPRVPQRLMDMPHVVLVPHIGSATGQTRQAMADLAFGNVREHFAGRPVLTPVPECASGR